MIVVAVFAYYYFLIAFMSEILFNCFTFQSQGSLRNTHGAKLAERPSSHPAPYSIVNTEFCTEIQ